MTDQTPLLPPEPRAALLLRRASVLLTAMKRHPDFASRVPVIDQLLSAIREVGEPESLGDGYTPYQPTNAPAEEP